MSMIQVGIIGVIGAVLAIQLKSGKTEYGIYVSVAVRIVLGLFILDRRGVFQSVGGRSDVLLGMGASDCATL